MSVSKCVSFWLQGVSDGGKRVNQHSLAGLTPAGFSVNTGAEDEKGERDARIRQSREHAWIGRTDLSSVDRSRSRAGAVTDTLDWNEDERPGIGCLKSRSRR